MQAMRVLGIKHWGYEENSLGKLNALEVLGAIENGQFIEPNDKGYAYIAQKLNRAAKQVYKVLRTVLANAPEHHDRIRILLLQPRLATESNTVILQNASSFEQFCALDDWFYNQPTPIADQHSFYFAHEKNYIYVKTATQAYNLFNVTLGYNKLGHTLPKYSAWEKEDPWQNPDHVNYIQHLDVLEIVRQPKLAAATLLKGVAFEAECIDEDERYGTHLPDGRLRAEACAEFESQQRLKNENRLVREHSAAHVLFSLFKKKPDGDICSNVILTSFLEEPLKEIDISLETTPREVCHTVKKAIENQTDDGLFHTIFKITIAKLGAQTTPILRKFIVERLSVNRNNND